jgi:mRNA-degrading endonuclease RelE of RelBE toxin-antitoxin system
MTYSIHPVVQQEFDEAFIWYENQQKGLGNKFSKKVFSAINDILSHPEAHVLIDNEGHRKYVMHIFPYKIIYKYYEARQLCSIVAIAHSKRKQGYWKSACKRLPLKLIPISFYLFHLPFLNSINNESYACKEPSPHGKCSQ